MIACRPVLARASMMASGRISCLPLARVRVPTHRMRSTMAIEADEEYDDAEAVWAASNGLGLAFSPCKSSVSKVSAKPTDLASLGEPLMEQGTFDLKFQVRGDVVVGFADAASAKSVDWKARAWGVSTATGCLHHSRSAMEDGMPGVELGPQRMVGDTAERLMHFEIDLDSSSVRLRIDEAAWVDVPVSVPSAVRPWALLPTDSSPDVVPQARLLACTEQTVPPNGLLHKLGLALGVLDNEARSSSTREFEQAVQSGTERRRRALDA